MSYKIQISVDDELNDLIKSGAEDMGLSISSYACLMLLSILPEKNKGLLTRVMDKGLKKWPHCDQIHVQKNVNRSLQETNDDFRGTILLCR